MSLAKPSLEEAEDTNPETESEAESFATGNSSGEESTQKGEPQVSYRTTVSCKVRASNPELERFFFNSHSCRQEPQAQTQQGGRPQR